MLFGAGAMLFMGAIGRAEKREAREAPARYAAAFDGRQTVTFEVKSLVGPRMREVVDAATARGYRLAHAGAESRGVQALVFERR